MPKLPSNACDCHFHIFDPRFPFAPGAVLHPEPASVAQYREVQRQLGTERGVLVQPSSYGTDNRCTLAALAALGQAGRAVAVLDDTVTDAELQRLHGLGVRGIRFNQVQEGATTVAMMAPLASRVAPLGWHVQVHMTADQLVAHESLLATLAAPLVLDHGARIPLAKGADHAALRVLRRLLDGGRSWVKISAPYLISATGAPDYEDAVAHGRALVRVASERVLWGSDWPHVTEREQRPRLDDLLAYLWNCAETETMVTRIAVDNPARLYQFN
jgi:D-galactarolactone isomerase